MSYEQVANVKCQSHRLRFTTVEWLDLDTFKERLRINGVDSVMPHVNTVDAGRVYIGKSVVRMQSAVNQDTYDVHEYIGMVSKLTDGTWNLDYVNTGPSMGETLFTVQNDFLVLSIPDANAYCWIDTQADMVPKYALRETCNPDFGNFVYIARTLTKSEQDTEHILPSVGTVDSSEWVLSVIDNSNNRQINKYQAYAMLCLKPSPAPLKELARLAIRKHCTYDNRKLDQLKQNLADALIAYLQYPRYLYVNDVLLPGDKLISQCGDYELTIIDCDDSVSGVDENLISPCECSSLVFRKIDNESDLDFEVGHLESVVLKSNNIIFCFTNDRAYHCFIKLNNKDDKGGCPYRMKLCVGSTSDTPFAIVEQLQENGSFVPTCIQDYYSIMKYRGVGDYRDHNYGERVYDDLYSDRSDNENDYDDYGFDENDDDGEFEYDFS